MNLTAVRTLLAPHLAWIRLGVVIAGALALAFAVQRVHAWRDGYQRLQATESALETSRTKLHQCTDLQERSLQAAQQAVAEAKEIAEHDRAVARRIEDALQTRLNDANARGRDLARRLSHDRGAGCGAVSGTADAAGVAAAAARDAGRNEAVGRVFGACARDSERLAAFQQWWVEVNR